MIKLPKSLQALFKPASIDVLERYELVRAAVHGTMSNFYMARERATDRIVGLKIGDIEKMTAFEARFKGLNKPPEGEIALAMKHPLIVESYEHGRTNKGASYLVMEYLKGPGLNHLIQDRSAALRSKSLNLIRQMAESIGEVHKTGYIHRDICPRNFISSPDASSLKLIDFGLTVPATEAFMQPGNRTGTPLYMAPEVVRRRQTDLRLDIFAFGVSAYHLLTFELPWPVGDSSGMVALAHDTHPPRDIFEYRPQLNRQLGDTIMKCMQADPDKRPQTMEQVSRMLRKAESEEEA